jgi:outer membrane protein assembly factor BamD
MKRALIICLTSMLLFSGCASIKKAWDKIFGGEEEKSAQELVWEGMDKYDNGDYKDAIKSFEQLRDWYPFSKYAILAELKIADSHYQLQQYDEAIVSYEEFERLHPNNEAIPYVIYQIGRSNFDQISTIDRDQTSTRKALEAFQRLQKQFPDDPYAHRAEDHISVCLKDLAGHEYIIGLFYYRTKHYKSALYRFKSVLTNYPDVGYHQQALQHIAECESILRKEEGRAGPADESSGTPKTSTQ